MMTRKEDMRAQHSKVKIGQAFRELLEEKGFAKTTVSDIIKRANVNRSTFYAHYMDKFDLLDKFEDELLTELGQATEAIPENVSEGGYIHGTAFKGYITSVLEIISNNREIFAIINDSVQGVNFQKKLFDHMNKVWSLHHINENLKANVNYVQVATVGMICSLIEKWIENGCEESVTDFSNIVSDIVGGFIGGVLD